MKALTGFSIQEFYKILPTFEKVLLDESDRKSRQRKIGGGQKGALKTPLGKLFFILFYLKTYATFDVTGFFFDVDKSQPCRWVKQFLPVLEETLGRRVALPKRRINSVEEFIQVFPEVTDVIIDGVERRTQRSKNQKQQKRCYSGKKKTHTRKNTIISDKDRRIMIVSPSKNGRIHDKKQLDKEGTVDHIPPNVNIWSDMGFQGIQKCLKNGNEIFMPKKKPRGKQLTPEEKLENKVISSLRMPVEHSINGIKRFGCLSQVYRNKNGIDDKFIFVCVGLWNFHLMCA
jgi:hypothetical protein